MTQRKTFLDHITGALPVVARLFYSVSMWRTLDQLKALILETSQSGIVPRLSYSQDGEDVVLVGFLPQTGFYVDVGAHHPERFSVTKVLYDAGWWGLNVDITQAIKKDFARRRPRDINVYGLAGTAGEVTLHRFAEQALNTTDPVRAQWLIDNGRKRVAVENHIARPLRDILDDHDVPGRIDLLSVDVEGHDLAVLESLDWNRWSVDAVLCELTSRNGYDEKDPIVVYLATHGLRPVVSFRRSVLFLSETSSDA